MSLDRYFRFGKNRGKFGNGRKKKFDKYNRTRQRGKNIPRSKYYNTLLDVSLCEPIHEEGGLPEFKVVFRNRPLLGKVFKSNMVDSENTNTKTKGYGGFAPFLQAEENISANIEHTQREILQMEQDIAKKIRDAWTEHKKENPKFDEAMDTLQNSRDEEEISSANAVLEEGVEFRKEIEKAEREVVQPRIDAYKEQQEEEFEKIVPIRKITRHAHKFRFIQKMEATLVPIRLRVVAIGEYNPELEGYECICQHADASRLSKKHRKELGIKIPSDKEEYAEYLAQLF